VGPQRDLTGPPGWGSAAHGLGGVLVRPGGAVGFPCPGVAVGGPGVVGVTLLVGCGVVVAVGSVGTGVVVGWSPDVGVVVGSVEDRSVSPGLGVSTARTGSGVTCGPG
jgi:hypothetical protein